MIYNAPCLLPGASFAHLPIYGLKDLGFVPRGEAPAQIPGARISVCHGVGDVFAASGTIIMSNEAP